MAFELGPRQVRMVYLITYSQADSNICSSREDFASKVLSAFRSSEIKVMHWACSRESHQDGGHHYHMAVKLDQGRRWLRVKQRLEAEHNMTVNFSSTHVNYYTAYKYVVKEDDNALHSPGHPDLGDCSPKSTAASRKRAATSTSKCTTKKGKKKRLSAFDVSEIVVQHNIKTRTQLLALANQQKQEGKTDLAEFIVNRGAKCVDEAIRVSALRIATLKVHLKKSHSCNFWVKNLVKEPHLLKYS